MKLTKYIAITFAATLLLITAGTSQASSYQQVNGKWVEVHDSNDSDSNNENHDSDDSDSNNENHSNDDSDSNNENHSNDHDSHSDNNNDHDGKDDHDD